MALNKNLISGSTTLLILRLLEEKDLYGYEMIELLRQRSKNVFELKAGTLSAAAFFGSKRFFNLL